MFPVVSTISPNLLDRAMRIVPRMRAWRFSSVVSAARPSNGPSRVRPNAANASPIERSRHRMPRFEARACASSTLSREVNGDDSVTPSTREGPSASAATAATSDESIPPDSPMIAPGNRFFST